MSGIDGRSPVWAAVVTYTQGRLVALRKELETPNKSERRSDELRGAIAELQELLKQAQAPTAPDPAPKKDGSGYSF